MPKCFFVTDLHGKRELYDKLFVRIESDSPDIVFIGGDLMPSSLIYKNDEQSAHNFIRGYMKESLRALSLSMKEKYPLVFSIMGNDDAKVHEEQFIELENDGLWHYINCSKYETKKHTFYGYSYIPPSPFMLKDWERYDVSKYVDPGCVPPEDGSFTVPVTHKQHDYKTIKRDLKILTEGFEPKKSVFLFHSPPYETDLDLADLEGKSFDHVPLDPHIGSIAIKNFIMEKQPMLTLHGHVHESTRLSGHWKQSTGDTVSIQGAHDGEGLALFVFDLNEPYGAVREIL